MVENSSSQRQKCNQLAEERIRLSCELNELNQKFAQLHQDLGQELIIAGNLDGYLDLLAAIDAWRDIKNYQRCLDLIDWGLQKNSSESIRKELLHLQKKIHTVKTEELIEKMFGCV